MPEGDEGGVVGGGEGKGGAWWGLVGVGAGRCAKRWVLVALGIVRE